jgi:hypothetical protein
MSAILPDRGDRNRGALDFYVNSAYFYGIELMRHGSSFKTFGPLGFEQGTTMHSD